MLAGLLSDLVVLIHLSFILFVLFGGFLVHERHWLIWLHVPIVIYGFLISLLRWICPLTPLENYLRAIAGEQGYEGGFVAHYILPLIYPEGMTQKISIISALVVLGVNTLAYGLLIYKIKRDKNGSET